MKSLLSLILVIVHMLVRFQGVIAFVSTTIMKRAAPTGSISNTNMVEDPNRPIESQSQSYIDYFRATSGLVSTPASASNGGRQIRLKMTSATTADVTNSTSPAQASSAGESSTITTEQPQQPLYLAEGLLAIHKPLTWSSNDVTSYIRNILTRDAHDRGAAPKGGGRRKKPLMKVGHGGTLDPLASGVLVVGVGKGTSLLQSYLKGDKQYTASCQLGYETDTLDAEGKLVKTAPWEHVKDTSAVETAILPKFSGKIEQIPPLYSAIRVNGKRLYEIARKDSEKAAEDVEIPKREVEISDVKVSTSFEESVISSGVVDGPRYREMAKALEEEAVAAAAEAAVTAAKEAEKNSVAEGEGRDNENSGKGKKRKRRNNRRKDNNSSGYKKSLFNEETVPSLNSDTGNNLQLPQFALEVKCGGGTYIRSLVRDIGYELDTVATMTGLVRTKQGPFVLDDVLKKEDWTAEKIYEAIRKAKEEKQIG